MLSRVNGYNNETTVWNKYSQNATIVNNSHAVTKRPNRLGGNTKHNLSSTWLRGIK